MGYPLYAGRHAATLIGTIARPVGHTHDRSARSLATFKEPPIGTASCGQVNRHLIDRRSSRMSTTRETPVYRDALERVINDVIAGNANDVDTDGTFPRQNVEALGAAGLLGLLSAPEVGGPGLGLREVAEVVERLAGACGSTAMIVLMHYAAVSVIEPHGPRALREAVASGRHLSTLAFSEAGSRSHFWAPLGTATRENGDG